MLVHKAVNVWLCVCTVENLLAKARGLSSRTYAQTINFQNASFGIRTMSNIPLSLFDSWCSYLAPCAAFGV